MTNSINLLATKDGFNTALRHFKMVNGVASQVIGRQNIADVINNAITAGGIAQYQIMPIVNALLVTKFDYVYKSYNLESNIENVKDAAEQLSAWTNLQIVLAYHNPISGVNLINPKNQTHLSNALPFIRHELLVVYLNTFEETSDDVKKSAINSVFDVICHGKKGKEKKGFVSSKVHAPPPPVQMPTAPPPAAATAAPLKSDANRKINVTSKYSVLVTNELFHNGNVEAWKKIIESYRSVFAGTDVLVWYDNERINDLNALFKWGKVKSGTPIIFSVAGEVIKGVAKLRRYLFEGASPRFEVFLKGGAGQTLDLF